MDESTLPALLSACAAVVTTIVGIAAATAGTTLRWCFGIDSSQGKLGLVVCEGLEGLQDRNVVRCMPSVREVKYSLFCGIVYGGL